MARHQKMTHKRGGASKTKKKSKTVRRDKYAFKEPLYEENKNYNSNKEKFIPTYNVVDGPAFASVVMNLNQGQVIVTQRGSMAYMDGHMDTKTTSRGGVWSGFKRMLFTSSSMFMTQYIGTHVNKNQICFASFLPGDILPIVVRPSERIIISPHSLVCFTDNLGIKTKRRVRGVLTDEGIAQTEFINESNNNGMIWLSSYGGYNKIILKENEKLKLDNGLFLCSHTSVKYSVGTVGNLKTTLLSGEGLVMNFTGPCELYAQGRSVGALERFIAEQFPRNNSY